MGNLKVKEKSIVVPGEEIAEGMDFLPGNGTYRDNEQIKAKLMGMLRVDNNILKVIPLSGVYMPKKGDKIIAKVTDILMAGWRFELNSPYEAMLPLKDASSDYIERGSDLKKYFDIDDYVFTEITGVSTQKLVDITMKGPMFKKLRGGRIIKINTHKVPRVIGKQGSMIGLIKKYTGCNIIIGQNGLIWLNGEPEGESIAYKAIKLVEEKSHTSGLTDEVEKLLKKLTKKDLSVHKTEKIDEQKTDAPIKAAPIKVKETKELKEKNNETKGDQ